MPRKKGQFVKGGSDSTDGNLSASLDIAWWGELELTPLVGVVSQLWACGNGLPNGLTKKQIADCRRAESHATKKLGGLVAEAIKSENGAALRSIAKVVDLLATSKGRPVDPERVLVLGLIAWLDNHNDHLTPRDVREIKKLENHPRQKWTLRIKGSNTKDGKADKDSTIEALVAKDGKLVPTVTTFLRWGAARGVKISRFTVPRIAKELGRTLAKAPKSKARQKG